MNKRGNNLVVENVVFIALNAMFLVLLGIFVSRQGMGAILLEQVYAKNIALLIDSAKPVTEITLDMKEVFAVADKNNIPYEEIVKITGNNVKVKLSSDGGYSYSFFNKVDATAYPAESPNRNYVIKINGYLDNEQ